jgi:hypothetical protein
VIVEPVNDRECLDAITAIAVDLVDKDDPEIEALAERFPTTQALAAWIRSLPQRDDEGAPGDGPKVVACEPPQRLRVAPPDPNCVERALEYIAAAERIDPRPVRRLATVDTVAGPHTFPVENDEPVVLDPAVSRNALRGGLFRNSAGPVRLSPREAVDWVADLAHEPAARISGGCELVEHAREGMHDVLAGIGLDDGNMEDVALVLCLAEREARAFGPRGVEIVLTTADAFAELDAVAMRNGRFRGWRVGRFRVRPHPSVVGLGRVAGRIGGGVASAALRGYLASQGLPPTLVDELESELNREGLTLGILGRAPAPGTIEEWSEREAKRRAA